MPQRKQSKPASLHDLLARAEDYANYSMRRFGNMPPTLFADTPDGQLMFLPDSISDDQSKDDFVASARLMCIAHAATAVVMALEAWMKAAKPGEKLDVNEPPSEAFDRQEVIMLMGETRETQQQKLMSIIRSDNGKFFGFGEPDAPDVGQIKGRFTGILPPKEPDEQMRVVAKAMLKVKGIRPAKTGTSQRRPPRQH